MNKILYKCFEIPIEVVNAVCLLAIGLILASIFANGLKLMGYEIPSISQQNQKPVIKKTI